MTSRSSVSRKASAFLSALLLAANAVSGEESGRTVTMKLGGVFTLDNSATFEHPEDPNLTLGKAELGANLGLSRDLEAAVFVAGDEGMAGLRIDQAAATLKPAGSPLDLVFGLHTFNHGFMTTRLISDPLLLTAAEMKSPGISASRNLESIGMGGGFTVRDGSERTGAGVPEPEYVGIANLDLIRDGAAWLRISGSVSPSAADFDAAVSRSLGSFDFDAEFFQDLAVSPGFTARSAYSAGAAYNLTASDYVAARADGLGGARASDWNQRISGGYVHHRRDGIFAAIEIARNFPSDGEEFSEIAFQIGLESTLELPGFERKTLTQE